MQNLKRILILSSEFPPGPGGIGTHAYQLARHFSAAGIKIRVLTPQDYAKDAEIADFNRQQDFEITTLPTHPVHLVKWVKRLRTFTRALGDFQPQMVIASGARAVWLSALLLALRKIPWVVVGHGLEFGLTRGFAAFITRLASNQAKGIICVSAYTQGARYALGVDKPADFIIHNGADQSTFFMLPEVVTAEFRQEEGVTDNFILLTVGRVSDRKGQEVVIRALPKILQEKPDTVYWMVGLPEIQTTLETIAQELGVMDAIRFWGRVENDQLRRLYNACDVFVMTSRQSPDGDFEGYGIAVLEAALCGKPAVVSGNSGLAEAVKDGITGIIVPQNDPNATAEVILNLTNSPEILIKLGSQAHQNVLENQTWGQVAKRYRDILQQIFQDSQ